MPEIIECPSCGRKLKVPDNLLGKTVRCTDCAGTFTAEKPGAAPPPPPPPPPQEDHEPDDRQDDDYDDRPSRRRSRRRSHGDYSSHRGGMVMAFGIISVVCVFVAGGAWVGFAPVGGAGNLLGLVFGILGWVMGGKDLAEIKAHRMDPDGRGMTQAGYIMGIIGTILHALGLLCRCIMLIVGAAFFAAMFQAQPPGGPGGPGPRPGKFEAPPALQFKLPSVPSVVDYLPPRPQ